MTTAMPTPASPSRSGTGWVSEISGLHGVLTYNYNGIDQRVSFHANRVFLFEKRLGLRHSLTFLLQLGEQLQFEAVPAEVGNHTNILDFCPMSATIVFKGKRPQIDPQFLDCPSTTGNMMCTLSLFVHSGNALEIWICWCRCILESSGSQNSGCT